MDDSFELYDLSVGIVGDPKTFVCSHVMGPAFKVVGENLIFENNAKFSLYAMSTILPLLPVKQRDTHKNDWVTSDELIACPDPNCGARFKISRLGKSQFKHSEVTNVNLDEDKE